MTLNIQKLKIASKDSEIKGDVKQIKTKKKKSDLYLLDQPIVSSPYIDKLVCAVNMPDPFLHGAMINGILDFAEEDTVFFKKAGGNLMFSTSVSIICPDENGEFHVNGPKVLFQATSKSHKLRQIRISFNPHKLFTSMNALKPELGYPVVEYLDSIFEVLWGGTFFEFLSHGRVTYMEIWRHVLGRKPEDYLFKRPYAKSYQGVFGNSAALETLYFGKSSGNQTVIYNKAKHLDKDAVNDTIRIEMRLKPKGLKMLDLWKMENPFKRVEIYSLWGLTLHSPLSAGHIIAFKDACRYRGIAQALKMQPAKDRTKLKKAISSIPVSWWPIADDIWFDLWAQTLEDCCLNFMPDKAQPLNAYKINGGW